jgi:protein-tyrosine-phosphatase
MNTSDVPTEEQTSEQPIRYVLFVCNHNAGRSQMAQAFFERYGPEDVRAESAGTEPASERYAPAPMPSLSVSTGRACART